MENCCCKKGVPAVIALFAFKIVAGMALCGGIFNWVYKLEPVNVWRQMKAPGISYYLGTLLVCFLFVFVYKKLFLQATAAMGKIKRGLVYGLCVWAVGCLPGMVDTHVFMTVNNTVVIYWTVLGFILTPIQGVIVSLIIGDGVESCSIKQ